MIPNIAEKGKTGGFNSKVAEAYSHKNLEVKYNGCKLAKEDFIDHETVLGGTSKKSSLLFMDNKGFSTGATKDGVLPSVGGFIDVKHTDPKGCVQKSKYSVTKVTSEVDSNNQKMVHVEMEDVTTAKMKRTFKDKSHSDKNAGDIIEEQIKDAHKDDPVKTTVIKSDSENKQNAQFGADKSLNDYMHAYNKDNSYTMIQDIHNNYIVHDEHRGFDKRQKSGLKFSYDAPFMSLNRILQYDVKSYGSDSYTDAAPSRATDRSPDSRIADSIVEDGHPNKEVHNETSQSQSSGSHGGVENTRLADITDGEKSITAPNKQKDTFNSLANAQEMTIWVPGRNMNLIGSTVEIDIPAAKGYKGQKKDKSLSGKWEVTHNRQKLSGGFFVQELFLRRPGK